MGLFTKLFKLGVGGGAVGAGTFFLLTRKSRFVPFSDTDPIFSSEFYNKFNPNHNPSLNDLCIRKVPLSKIRPELLEQDGRLVEAFCAGIFGGKGYSIQREFLAKKYRGPDTAHQLWTPEELQSSTYPVGTQMTDHFEVLEHTPGKITVRCGDSPRHTEVRPSDGLFEMAAGINKEDRMAEFRLKSVFFQGVGSPDGPPMPAFMVFLHKQYTKLWMETAVRFACIQ